MEEKKNKRDLMEISFTVCRFLWTAAQETLRGTLQNRVPGRMCYFGIALGTMLYFRCDAWLLSKVGFKNHLTGEFRNLLIYSSPQSLSATIATPH